MIDTCRSRIADLMRQQRLSFAELSERCGVPASTLHRYVSGTTDKMDLGKLKRIAKALGVQPTYLLGWEEAVEPVVDTIPVRRIPILGRISAGLPLYAEEQVEGYTWTDLNGGNEYFALRVQGDSMNAANINEGDLLIVRKQDYVDNGGIAVVMVDGEDATVKRFYREGNTVTLVPQSTNPAHAPQIYDIRKTKIKVMGKVLRSQTVFE